MAGEENRGANLPSRDTHEGFIKRLLEVDKSIESEKAKYRNALKPHQADRKQIFQEARDANVCVRALKEVHKMQKAVDRYYNNLDDHLDADDADEARAIIDQLEMFPEKT